MKENNSYLPIKNQDGIAIIMVMTSITFLILILATFTYDTKVNKIRLYNQQERMQAKLNAESGLKFAMLRLEIYQKARNLLEKNKNIKDILSPQLLQSILIMPFFYPIPPIGDMNIIQKTALSKFNDDILLDGKLNISMIPVRGFLNPNNMIIHQKLEPDNQNRDDDDDDKKNGSSQARMAQEVEKNIIQMLSTNIDQQREDSEIFNSLYSNLSAELLVKELKYYITPKGEFKDQELAQIEPLFDNLGIEPKFAPLSSIDELNLLPSWDDDIIDLIKENLTAHHQSVINIEQITKKQLLSIFPTLNAIGADEFFEYRDGNSAKELDPHEIKSVTKFEQILTGTLGIIPPEAYKEAMTKLKQAGINLGVSNLLFEITSTGNYNRSQYVIKAVISIPMVEKEAPQKNPTKNSPADPDKDPDGVFNPDGTKLEDDPKNPSKKSEQKKEIEFLSPRIEEISNG